MLFHLHMQGVTYGLSAGLPYPSISELPSKSVTLSPPWHPWSYLDICLMAAGRQAQGLQLTKRGEAGTRTFVPVLHSCPSHGSLPLWMLSQSSTAASWAPVPDAADLIHTAGEGKFKRDHGKRFKGGKQLGHYISMPWLLCPSGLLPLGHVRSCAWRAQPSNLCYSLCCLLTLSTG